MCVCAVCVWGVCGVCVWGVCGVCVVCVWCVVLGIVRPPFSASRLVDVPVCPFFEGEKTGGGALSVMPFRGCVFFFRGVCSNHEDVLQGLGLQ
mgnify:CR=1 FL=1